MTRDLDFKGSTPERFAKTLLPPVKRDSAAKAHQGDDKGTNAESEQPRVRSRISTND